MVKKLELLKQLPTHKKIAYTIVFTLVFAFLVGCVSAYSPDDPIVISIQYDDMASPDPDGVYFFHEDEFAQYYLPSGIHPFDVTVKYLLAGSDALPDALIDGHITIKDLDRFGIEYGTVLKD